MSKIYEVVQKVPKMDTVKELLLRSLVLYFSNQERIRGASNKHDVQNIEQSVPALLFESGFHYGRSDWILTALTLDPETRPLLLRTIYAVGETMHQYVLTEINFKHLPDEVRWQWWRLNRILDEEEEFCFPPYGEIEFTSIAGREGRIYANVDLSQIPLPSYVSQDDEHHVRMSLDPIEKIILQPWEQFRFEYRVMLPESFITLDMVDFLLGNTGELLSGTR